MFEGSGAAVYRLNSGPWAVLLFALMGFKRSYLEERLMATGLSQHALAYKLLQPEAR